ncbi:IS3 family transposase, partial [Mesorhizobium sp. VK25A]
MTGIARSTYYDRLEKPADDTAIVEAMFAISDEFEFYGYRRVGAALRQQGLVVNPKKIRRLMREHDLQPRIRRRFVEDLNIAGAMPPACRNNLVPTGCDIPAASAASSLVSPCAIPNQNRWSSDRSATGGRPGDSNGARPERCDRRFPMPIATSFVQVLRRPLESAQYAAQLYRETLGASGLNGSMGRRGNPYDNAKAESFLGCVSTLYLQRHHCWVVSMHDVGAGAIQAGRRAIQ